MDVDPRLIKARAQLVLHQPFFGVLALNLKIVENNKIETMATDGRCLYYSRPFLDEIDADELIFGWAHEVDHCALKHHLRRNGRDKELWNIACDHVINLSLKKAGFKVPKWAFCDPQYEGLRAEDVYRLLEQKQQNEQKPEPEKGEDDGDDGQSSGKSDDKSDSESGSEKSEDDGDEDEGDGNDKSEDNDDASDEDSGNGDSETSDDGDSDAEGNGPGSTEDEDGDGNAPESAPDPGRCGAVIDGTEDPGEAADMETEWDIAVAQAIGVAQKAGTLPGCAQAIVDMIKKPKADWRAVLRQFMDPSSRKDYSWSRPNRRFAGADFVMPGMVTDGVNHIGVVLDDSGSTHRFVPQFVAELQAALDEGGVDKFTVIHCDTEVHEVSQFENGDQLVVKPMRNGGTYFEPAFRWFEENEPDVSGIVYFTDMQAADWPLLAQKPSLTKTLWAGYGDPRWLRPLMAAVPFGETIELDE